MERARPGWVSLALLGLAASGSWLFYYYVGLAGKEMQAEAPASPDYFLEHFVAVRTGKEGLPQYHLEARRLVHYPAPLDSLLSDARLRVSPEDDSEPWYVRAEQGRLSADGERWYFPGRVELERAASAHHPPWKLETRDVRVFPGRSLVETDAPVRVHSRGGIIESVGLRALLKESRVDLLSRVRGSYETSEPQQNHPPHPGPGPAPSKPRPQH
jgi:lipopolysaccharide export system protein LptC